MNHKPDNEINVLLVAINAKYIHSCLSLRYLKVYYENHSDKANNGDASNHSLKRINSIFLNIKELNINNDKNYILSEIYAAKPDVVCFSVYIWNVDLVCSLIKRLKKILPEALVVLGGPEVTYDAETYIDKNIADYVIAGEGERAFASLLDDFSKNQLPPSRIITGEPVPLIDIPFPYPDLNGLENKIIYYETSRGCANRCAYCLSGNNCGMSFLPMERIKRELLFFIDAKVKQIKFVDRTFNQNKTHTLSIWNFLISVQENCVTNFHFEISADLLTDDMIELLKEAKHGLFQFEIGIQSTNEQTLAFVSRKTNIMKCADNITQLINTGNMNVHLDLIAGLPGDGLASFVNSFNTVYSLSPDMLQLGFLKLLKGSKLREDANELGIIYGSDPPYEVLKTATMSYDDLLLLRDIENLTELYYNSRRLRVSLMYIKTLYQSPFTMFKRLNTFYQSLGYKYNTPSINELYKIAWNFIIQYINTSEEADIIHELIKFDFIMKEKRCPLDWMYFDRQKKKTASSVNNKYNHTEIFSIDIVNYIQSGFTDVNIAEQLIRFDFKTNSYEVVK